MERSAGLAAPEEVAEDIATLKVLMRMGAAELEALDLKHTRVGVLSQVGVKPEFTARIENPVYTVVHAVRFKSLVIPLTRTLTITTGVLVTVWLDSHFELGSAYAY